MAQKPGNVRFIQDITLYFCMPDTGDTIDENPLAIFSIIKTTYDGDVMGAMMEHRA